MSYQGEKWTSLIDFTSFSGKGVLHFQLYAGYWYHVRQNYDHIIVFIGRLSMVLGDAYGWQVNKWWLSFVRQPDWATGLPLILLNIIMNVCKVAFEWE